MPETILLMEHITKTYPGVKALSDVTVSLDKGETLALVGENGAGKSTLIKVLSGAITPDKGKIIFDGKEYSEMTPTLSKELGIAVIYQEFNLMQTMSVAENIYMGETVRSKLFFNHSILIDKAKQLFAEMGVDIDPSEQVKNLSVAYMQLVEIAKALSKNVRILVMDEPTAPLTDDEVEILFSIIEKLKKRGVSIIYISHRLNEIFRVTDRVVVMRDGKVVEERKTSDINRDMLIKSMVGREISDAYPKRDIRMGEEILKVDHLTGNGDRNISFSLHRGEVLGLAGLVGAGRTELVRMIFGADRIESGIMYLDGKEYHPNSPVHAVQRGIGLIPEDRKRHGAILNLPIKWNITLPVLKRVSKLQVLNRRKENRLVEELIEKIMIKTPSSLQQVGNLSGGNQQKVVLAKWLAVNCKVLIFDEPTRGIDVGAKYEIYKLMNQLCENGIGILMISSDMEEMLGMADRIIVLCEGSQTGELKREEFDQEKVLSYASGNK